jgi:HK97 family phage major capsid protein
MSGAAESELADKKLQIALELQRHQEERIDKRKARAEVESALNPVTGVLPTIAALTPHEKRRYSITAALRDMAARRKEMTLELEVSMSIAKDLRAAPAHGGRYIPLSINASGLDTKSNGSGGYLQAHPVSGDIIDYLASTAKILQLGARFISSVRFAPAFPVEATPVSAQWVSENGSPVTDVDPSFQQRITSGRMLAASTSLSRQLLAQSSADLEQWLRSKIALSHSMALDRASLHGSGSSNEPVGLLASGISDVAVGANGGAVTVAHLIELERLAGDGDAANSGFITNSLQRSKLRTVPLMTSGSVPVWNEDRLLGHRAEVSNQVRQDLMKGSSSNCSALVYSADWSKLLLFEFAGAFELVLDEFSQKRRGLVELCSWGSYDILCQQPGAFAAIKDAI